MNILILTKKIPFPVRDGESIAIMSLARNFAKHNQKVTMLCMQTPKHNFEINNIPPAELKAIKFESVFVDTSVKVSGVLLNIFTSVPYHIQRFISSAFMQKLVKILANEQFDIVQLEGLYLAPYISVIRKKSQACIVLRSHNIEGNIWSKYSVNEKNVFKKYFLKWQAKKLWNYERKNVKLYDAIVPISLSDNAYYSGIDKQVRLCYIPAGIDVQEKTTVKGGLNKNIYFLGALDWAPNTEGLKWFIQKVFPLILKKEPDLLFHIAGRNDTGYVKGLLHDNIIFYGEVEDAEDFVKDKTVCIVPLLSGSGMKVKILEAMANGKYVVTTPTGIEGFPPAVLNNCAVSENEEAFANAVLDALQNLNGIAQKGNNAADYIKYHFDNTKLCNELLHFYESL